MGHDRPRFTGGLLAVLRATRIHKLVPLPILMLDAALFRRGRMDWTAYGVAAAIVLLAACLGAQLNVLTDAELDRSTKPHLMAWLTRDRAWLRAVLAAEVLAGAGLLLHAWARLGGALFAGAAVFAALNVLYSYNVVTFWDPAGHRLKLSSWGNALAAIGSYLALWLTGFACAGASWVEPPIWLWIALSASLVDYGLFLSECAADAAVECASGLRTLPALLGRRRASLAGLAISLLGSAGAGVALLAAPEIRSPRTVAALSFHAGIQVLAGVRCLGGARWLGRWEAVLDGSCWTSRIGMLAVLVLAPRGVE